MKRLFSAAIGLALPMTLAATMVPAGATTVNHRDPHDDVVVMLWDEQGGLHTQPIVDPAADIQRLHVAHRARRVVVRAKLAEVTRGDFMTAYTFRFRTPRGRAMVSAGGSEAFFFSESKVGCRGLRFHSSYGRDVITLEVPRRCLDRPRWVRVGLQAMSDAPVDEAAGIPADSVSVDDVWRTGLPHVSALPALGPRVRRG